MITGDIVKYLPTATVGKVTDVRERDGKIWAKLDRTNLYYDVTFLIPAEESEYKATAFQERETQGYSGTGRSVEDLQKMEEEVDISEMMPSGGG